MHEARGWWRYHVLLKRKRRSCCRWRVSLPILLTDASKRSEESTRVLWRLWQSYRGCWLLVSVPVEYWYCAVTLRWL